jgi:exodeoxyribonuclease V alpha subunit
VPVIEYPADEDLVRIALTTQENSESVQSWDFLDKAFLVKKLYDELGTQEKVAEKIGWERTTVSRYLTISSLPEECVTVIRKSVTVNKKNTGTPECDHGHTYNLDNIWSVRWFRHICSLPTDELKLMVIEKIADNPSSWKEKEVASECSRLKKRYELAFKVKSILGEQDNCKEDLTELLEAIDKGLYDSQPEKATERAEAILKARRRTDVELLADFGYEPQVYTIWNFTNRDERFGIKHPGNLAAVNIGSVLRLKGDWKYNHKYGKQFNVVDYRETVPATIAGIEKYLGSGLIKGIGPVYARRIVNYFKEDTLKVIEEQADYLVKVEGIGQKRVEMIKNAWQEQKEIKNVMLFLQSHGVSTAYAVKIYKTYGDESINIVTDNPYRLADDIWGIGFKTADKIAQQLGFDPNSYERCRAGIFYTLNQLSNAGHCYALREQLVSEAVKMLDLEEGLIGTSIQRMIAEKSLISDISDQDDAIYLPPFYFSEEGIAERIKKIIATNQTFKPTIDIKKFIDEIQRDCGIVYDKVQLDAIKTAVESKFMILTGGPGTGKTTTTLAIIRVFQKMGASCLLAAPTGRAAKRLSETTGMEAKTIHRLLEYKPNEGYKRNKENPLECDVLIIDETSMVDIILMYNLLKAVSDQTVVILIGDADQLPSVGAGNVLKDIIASGIVSVVRLTRIFRQAQGSAIITNAHRINKGEMPRLRCRRNSDFFFIEEEESSKIAETIRDLCTKRLPRYYHVNPISDIQVLCPMQRGEAGVHNLNSVLQEALNRTDITVKYGGAVYRLHDKVMQIKNNYDKNVFNGDIGTIVKMDTVDKTLVIRFDGIDVDYDATELDEVVLSYATTIHKSQGSEYKIVVAPFTMQHYLMLQRNLLYTCVTRAKNILVLVGSKKALRIAVSNNKIQQRNTMLAERLAHPFMLLEKGEQSGL